MKRFLTAAFCFCFIVLTSCHVAPAPASSARAVSSARLPEAAAVTEDPHSHARPDEVRVRHVALDLEVDFERKQLRGSATLQVERMMAAASTLILDTAGLTISRIALTPGDSAAKFELGAVDPIFGRKLKVELRPDTTHVVIHYSTDPAAGALQWLEPEMTTGKRFPFLLSQSQSVLARSWVPLQDTPHVRFTYDATLRVPKELLALMSAGNPQEKSSDGVYRFRMEQPIPSYLMALAVGDLAFRSFDDRTGVYAEVPVLDAAAREFDELPKMMRAAEALYGPYQWKRYDLLVLPPSFPYGGMENPRLTFLTPTLIAGDKSLVDVVAHELAHSWSGNLVTNATWNDFWLNEGFTTYIQHRIMAQLHGREYSEMLWSLEYTETRAELATLPPRDQGLYLQLEGRDPGDAPSTVYGKGALLLRLIEETVGRAEWDQFLRSYFDARAFQTVTTTEFIAELESAFPGISRRVNLDEWIFGSGLPANCPVPQSTAFEAITSAAETWVSAGKLHGTDPANWSSHERVHFIESLPTMSPERMAGLDRQFHFSESGNSEVLFVWLRKAARERYQGAYPAIERFLTVQGRRKFIRPIYAALAQNPEDREFARKMYERARPTYHPVSQASIDVIFAPANGR